MQPVTPGAPVTPGTPPIWAILSWACYCRIDPLGLSQNARWTDLLLATGLTGQLRKGQFSSHLSTDQCTLNIHRSHRDPVIPVPVWYPVIRVPVRPVPGNTGYTRYTGSDQVQPVTPGAPVTPGTPPIWAILSWACYCRIDPLGLNQNARWTDLLLAIGLTGQLRKGQFSSHLSTDQCTLNIHRSHRDPVIPVQVWYPVPGHGARDPVPSARKHQIHRVRPGATGQKAQKGTGQSVPGPVRATCS